MTDKVCPRCGSWKVYLYTQGYYICCSDECRNGLLEIDELVVPEVAPGVRGKAAKLSHIIGLLSLR